MAEGLANRLGQETLSLISAATSPSGVHAVASQVMEKIGIDINRIPLRSVRDVDGTDFGLVITLGDFDKSALPTLPGLPPHLHWDLPGLDRVGPGKDSPGVFRQIRDLLEKRVAALFDSGILETLFLSRRVLQVILNNLLDGVMAHNIDRRIFYFNRAAEKITGYRRQEILGKDCHDVFPGRFCGGDCLFCDSVLETDKAATRKEVLFTRPDGEELVLEMATMPLIAEDRSTLGALVSFKDSTELFSLRRRLQHHHSLGVMVGKDPKMLALFDQIREVAAVNAPVLIQGESGTGKELVSNAIHESSLRSARPFVAINCGALPEGILESELFGHVRGAFTGAVQDKKGRFELADGGTLFLDEVGELSPAMQVKLLRVLQDQRFFRVGGEKSIKVNVRIISATNQNLRLLMTRGRFRRDLFYRLCVVPIKLPPLRERRLDIPMLVEHFVEQIGKETARPLIPPSTGALDAMTSYGWPGNVRELRNAIEYMYVKCYGDEFGPEHLPPEITSRGKQRARKRGPAPKFNKEQVLAALARADGNRMTAARILGIGRATLYRYLKSFDIP